MLSFDHTVSKCTEMVVCTLTHDHNECFVNIFCAVWNAIVDHAMNNS